MIPERSQAGYELTSSLVPMKHSAPERNLSGSPPLDVLASGGRSVHVLAFPAELAAIHMRCMMTPSRLVSATFARVLARRPCLQP